MVQTGRPPVLEAWILYHEVKSGTVLIVGHGKVAIAGADRLCLRRQLPISTSPAQGASSEEVSKQQDDSERSPPRAYAEADSAHKVFDSPFDATSHESSPTTVPHRRNHHG